MKYQTRLAWWGTLIAVVLSANACNTTTKPSKPAASLPPAKAVDTTGATRYEIDSKASDVHILVYRGGAMARLGHNHVVSSANTSGTVLLNSELSRSHVSISMPVASLLVDDAAARRAEGEEFSAEVPADAREGTKKNLLRDEVLDAEHFSTITLQSMSITGTRAAPQMVMRVAIKGTARDVPVQVKVVEEGKRLTATGEFSVNQTDFGMTPFSVALGALQVVDTLKIKFKIVATAG